MSHACHSSHQNIGLHNRKFVWGIILNIIFIIVELAFGFLSESMALVSDALHNFGDVLGLGLALCANILLKSQSAPNKTYGWRSFSILASFISSLSLVFILGALFVENLHRLNQAIVVNATVVIWVSLIGLAINLGTALLFLDAKEKDFNIKAAYLHMLADALISGAVMLGGVAMYFTDWWWVDGVLSFLVILFILYSTLRLTYDSAHLLLAGVPKNINLKKVQDFFTTHKDIQSFHDLHIWALSTAEVAMTVHLLVNSEADNTELLKTIDSHFDKHFGIGHCTVQIERSETVCKPCN
ncbi:MAG: cation transporter [Bdellovibrionaceae bacterium]|nr:cation transporter [Pseudobdellovibrionaceae bacterium]